jgi:peptide deformylase
MAILPVLVYPDERLKRVAEPVSAFDAALRGFLADFDETMRAAPGCVGLAAPQVGYAKRIALVDVSARANTPHNGRLLLINPVVDERGGEIVGREGCLSVPDYTGNVARAEWIRLRAQDALGQWRAFRCEGYEARAVLHELDHLDGLLFLDRLVSRRDLFRRKVYKG